MILIFVKALVRTWAPVQKREGLSREYFIEERVTSRELGSACHLCGPRHRAAHRDPRA